MSTNTNELKLAIIAQLIDTGMTTEEAEATYAEQFETGNANVRLPFPLLKVNNVAGVADMGDLVGDPVKDGEDEIISYNIVHKFKDIDFLTLNRKTMYNAFDGETGRTTIKTKLMDTYTGAATFVDVISGKTIAQLKDEGAEPKYQMLLTVGVRAKGSKEAFKIYSFYAKGSILFGLNKVTDANREASPYQLLSLSTKIGKKGAVRYTEIDLETSTSRVLTKTELLGNLSNILEANKKYSQYVKDINAQYDAQSVAPSADDLPV